MQLATLDNAIPSQDTHWGLDPVTIARSVGLLATIDTLAHLREWRRIRDERAASGRGSEREAGYTVANGRAQLSLKGTLTKDPHSLSDYVGLGGTSTRNFAADCYALLNDPSVRDVILDIDSPGGGVDGGLAAMEALKALNAKKPVAGYVEDRMCSLALMIVCGAGIKTVANPAAAIGACNMYMVVEDTSKAQEQRGKKTYVIMGDGGEDLKGAGEEGTEITEVQRAAWKRSVNARLEPFMQAVQSGKEISAKNMATVRTADVWYGDGARVLGLIDKVGDRSAAMKLLDNPTWRNKPKAKASSAENVTTLLQNHRETATMPQTLEQKASAWDNIKAALGMGSHEDDPDTGEVASLKAQLTGTKNALTEANATITNLRGQLTEANAALPTLPTEREQELQSQLATLARQRSNDTVALLGKGKLTPADLTAHETIRFACEQAGMDATKAYDAHLASLPLHPAMAQNPARVPGSVPGEQVADALENDRDTSADTEADDFFKAAVAAVIPVAKESK